MKQKSRKAVSKGRKRRRAEGDEGKEGHAGSEGEGLIEEREYYPGSGSGDEEEEEEEESEDDGNIHGSSESDTSSVTGESSDEYVPRS